MVMSTQEQEKTNSASARAIRKIFLLPAYTHAFLLLALFVLLVAVAVGTWKRSTAPLPAGRAEEIRAAAAVREKININTAGWIRLTEIPGIGRARSKAIIHRRTQYGPFDSLDDVLKIPGFPDSLKQSLQKHAFCR